METQLELLKRAIQLAEQNPDMEIHCCVDGDDISDYGWTAHKIEKVCIAHWIMIGDYLYDDIESAMSELLDTTDEPETETEMRNRLEKQKAICIYTVAG